VKKNRLWTLVCRVGMTVIAATLSAGIGVANAKPPATSPEQAKRITQAERQAAAERAAEGGFDLLQMEAAIMAMPGEAPRYFSHPNYANSPLPVVSAEVISVGNPLIERAYATDFVDPPVTPVPVFVVLPDAVLPDGQIQSFEIFNQTLFGGSPGGSEGNSFYAFVLRPTGIADEYEVVFESAEMIVPAATDPAGNMETFSVGNIPVQAGDVIGFYGAGIPVDIDPAGTDIFSYPAPAPPAQGDTITLGSTDFPIYPQARIYSFAANVLDLSGSNVTISGGIRKFVDSLPGLNAPNNLGQEIPVAVPDTTIYPDSDYYEIAVVEYEKQMHTDLPATTLRGYVQLVPGSTTYLTEPQYLGPAIVAAKNRPVRILFRNLLPTGTAGNLFLPTDVTVMGSGIGPLMDGMLGDPQNPMCGMIPKPSGCFTENRATLHLHGGTSPWISDGTPHQWITPANEPLSYPDSNDQSRGNKGVSVQYVPDMWFNADGSMIASCAGQTTCEVEGATNDPGPGAQTYYYTNQQSARLMFYHDHAWGITRLNVYAGMAAPYIIADDTEQALEGLLPTETIPLVIQDKTFVPSQEQLDVSDETWDTARWGGEGSLWLPHVYSPAQNPGDSSGVNQFGRWAYGPWFWPPTFNIDYPPVANPYYDPACDPDVQWCEPPMMPGTPYNSMGMEAFNDTPVVNGTAYPTLTVEPKAYRFRILNAASDRFFNLSLYVADESGKEVALNPAEVQAALTDPTVFPTPVAPAGPDWIQIGTEGGFLPAPVVIPPHPTTWVNDPTVFNAGNVDLHSLLIAPAERADVIVDFSNYAGQTLILYNDAPAAFPARDPRYDYYTGNPDLRDTGGAPSTLPGYGPNIRTVMQIVVGSEISSPSPVDLAGLQAAFAHQTDGSGVFESGQHPIIVGQGAYNSAYGASFPNSGVRDGFARITDFSLTFNTLDGGTLTMPFQPKAIQDEQGEAFDKEYGRMSGNLGLEVPLTQAGVQQNLILYPYSNPASEVINATRLPRTLNPEDPADTSWEVQPISDAGDGAQIWKITHNGVDTHPIHFHLFDVQLINRVGWDGIIRPPEPNELGWKDTVRVSPLEDTIVALRPIIPVVPFDMPNSIRPLNPMMPLGSMMGFTNTDANATPTDSIINALTNFGQEYVWHCHILSHEEMDMMRPISVAMTPNAPTSLSGAVTGNGNNRNFNLTWEDNSANETSFVIQRATDSSFTTGLTTFTTGPDVATYTDPVGNTKETYFYRVFASNTVGYNATPGYSTMTVDSGFTDVVSYPENAPVAAPAAPSGVNATASRQGNNARVTLNWTDNASNENGFTIQMSTDAAFTANLVTATVGENATTFTTGNVARNTPFYFRVQATNGAGPSAWVNATPFPITTP